MQALAPARSSRRFRSPNGDTAGAALSRPGDRAARSAAARRTPSPHLTQALDDPDSETRISVIWALGSSGRSRGRTRSLMPLYTAPDADPGIRKIVVYALGALPGDAQLPTLRTALQDRSHDVRWNAAVALARQRSATTACRCSGRCSIGGYVEQAVKRDVRQD